MIGMENRTIHSKNLTFRLLRQEDKPFLYPILQEPETTRPAGFPLCRRRKHLSGSGMT